MLPSLTWYSASAIAAAFRSSQAALVSTVEASSTTSGSPTMDFVRMGVIDGIARLLPAFEPTEGPDAKHGESRRKAAWMRPRRTVLHSWHGLDAENRARRPVDCCR